MIFPVEFTPHAVDDLSRIDRTIARSISNKIDWLSRNIDNITPTPLKGQFKGKYKLRVGDWRVIYSFDSSKQVVTVYAVKHRSEVYKI